MAPIQVQVEVDGGTADSQSPAAFAVPTGKMISLGKKGQEEQLSDAKNLREMYGRGMSDLVRPYMGRSFTENFGRLVGSVVNKGNRPSQGKGGQPGAELVEQYLVYEQLLQETTEQDSDLLSNSLWFNGFVALGVVANLQVLALEVDYGCWDGWWGQTCSDGFEVWAFFDSLFACMFLVELALRLWWHGLINYIRGDPMVHKCGVDIGHCIDTVLILSRGIDAWVLTALGVISGIKLVSAFRVFRLGSFVKRVRLFRFFRELWLIIAGMQETCKTLFVVLIILMIILWTFAILMTLAVGEADIFNFSMAAWSKDDYWGSTPKAFFSLFQVITLDKWASSLTWPLIQQRTWIILILIPFLCIAVLALLNTIVGVIVESTLNSARQNDEKQGKEKRILDAKVMHSLRMIFKEADADNSGTLDLEELHRAMSRPHVRDRMKMLDIPVKDLDLLFNLLDEEGKGTISIDVFFRGCSRIRGPALACDLHHMSVDLDRNIKWADKSLAKTEELNDALESLINHLDVVDIDIIRGEGDEKDPVLMARRNRVAMSKKGKMPRASHRAAPPQDSHPLAHPLAPLARSRSPVDTRRAPSTARSRRSPRESAFYESSSDFRDFRNTNRANQTKTGLVSATLRATGESTRR